MSRSRPTFNSKASLNGKTLDKKKERLRGHPCLTLDYTQQIIKRCYKYLSKYTNQNRKSISPQQYHLCLHAVTHAVDTEILKEQLPLDFLYLKLNKTVCLFCPFGFGVTNSRPLWQEHFDNWELSAHALPRHSGFCSPTGAALAAQAGPAAPGSSAQLSSARAAALRCPEELGQTQRVPHGADSAQRQLSCTQRFYGQSTQLRGAAIASQRSASRTPNFLQISKFTYKELLTRLIIYEKPSPLLQTGWCHIT